MIAHRHVKPDFVQFARLHGAHGITVAVQFKAVPARGGIQNQCAVLVDKGQFLPAFRRDGRISVHIGKLISVLVRAGDGIGQIFSAVRCVRINDMELSFRRSAELR